MFLIVEGDFLYGRIVSTGMDFSCRPDGAAG